MSRARSIKHPNGKLWYDTHRMTEQASDEQLELLATVEQIDLDDLLDEILTQQQVVSRLREGLHGGYIPAEVIERRQKWRERRQVQPSCRKCGKVGDSTKHHFVNKWILRELEGYQSKWADRSKNTIPICIDCHRDLHSRENGPESIVSHLSDEEKRFAEAALTALADERPKLLVLIARGDSSVYEARLVKDWFENLFSVKEEPMKHLMLVR